jgi:hypothetical protein
MNYIFKRKIMPKHLILKQSIVLELLIFILAVSNILIKKYTKLKTF